MKITVESTSPGTAPADALVVLASADGADSDSFTQLDKQCDGFLSSMVKAQEISTDLGKASTFISVPGVQAERVVVIGAGKQADFDAGAAARCAGTATKLLAARSRNRVVFALPEVSDDLAPYFVSGAMNGCQGQDILRSGDKSLHPIQELAFHGLAQTQLDRGVALGEGVLLTRELVNLPANYIYPESFTRRAAEVCIAEGIELEVWDELRLRREGCGSLLGVSAGSAKPPRLLIMRYQGTRSGKPLALVGKGVTFDSGGLSLKPSDGMLTMKCDMAGAATVLGAMQSIARLKVDAPVVGLVGLVENMISGHSFKLGDVLTSRSGKTIEIHNTDAEGRLVLADVLNVALDEGPSKIIDLATLTGACVVALGNDFSGLMSNDVQLQSELQRAAAKAGELVWSLPMHSIFDDQIKSKVADIKNMGDGRWGGAITAAKFLQQFVAETPWVHVDIAGPAFADSPKPHIDAGASGAMVGALVAFAESL